MTDKLKPCPLCGQPARMLSGSADDGPWWTPGCTADDCCIGPTRETKGEAVALWNHRVYQLEPPPAVLPVVDPERPPLDDDDRYWRAIVLEAIRIGNSPKCAMAMADVVLASERERRKP